MDKKSEHFETTGQSNVKVIKVSVSTRVSLSLLEWDSNMEKNEAH